LASDFVFSNPQTATFLNNHISAVSVTTPIHTAIIGIPQGITREQSCYVGHWGGGDCKLLVVDWAHKTRDKK
jgi:hypothetical protein